MSLPRDINPVKFTFAVFGIPLPRRAGEGWQLFLQRFSALLEIPVHRMDEALLRLKAVAKDFEDLFEQRRDRMLHLPSLLDRVVSTFIEEVVRVFGIFPSPDQDLAIEEWITNHLLIDEADFAELILPIMLRFQESAATTQYEREMHRNLADWCEDLALRWPVEYENALHLMRPVVRDFQQAPNTPLSLHPEMQRLAQIGHQQDRAFQEEKDGQMFSAIVHAIDAWSQAYEGPVNAACSFIFMVAFPPRAGEGLGKLPRTKHGLNKTNIFDEAVKWCERSDVEFPFYETIRAVRNAKSHSSVIFKESSVVFQQVEGPSLELSFSDLLVQSEVDVFTAQNFFQAAEIGRIGALARSGRYDAAWERACQRIPNLTELVVGPLDLLNNENGQGT